MTETEAKLDVRYDLVVSLEFLVTNRAGFLVPLFNAFDKTFLYSKAPPPLEYSRVKSGLFVLGYARF